MNVNEKDWKMLRKKLPDWQENYMERLNNEYMGILSCILHIRGLLLVE